MQYIYDKLTFQIQFCLSLSYHLRNSFAKMEGTKKLKEQLYSITGMKTKGKGGIMKYKYILTEENAINLYF